MTRVLVTGASGFIGRACVAGLVARGCDVHGTGRGGPPDGPAGLRWHVADLLDAPSRRDLLRQVRPSHLVHLAWEARPGLYRDSPDNPAWAEASCDLLKRALDGGAERIVGIGSCFEYGRFDGPCREDLACRPVNRYGGAKLAVAQAFTEAADRGAGAAWGRVFFPFGPGDTGARLIPSLIRALSGGGTFDCSHGAQLRDFIYLEDLADAIATVLASRLTGVVNLASGEARSLRSIIAHVAQLVGGEDRVRYGARQPTGLDDAPMIVADTGKLRRETGWVPRIGCDEGAARTVAWWSSRPGQSSP